MLDRSRACSLSARGKIFMMTSTRSKLSMVQVDVFTDRALTGNSLAVFLDGRGLSTEQMQDMAREMNLSETTFILPGDAAAEKDRGSSRSHLHGAGRIAFCRTSDAGHGVRSARAGRASTEVRLDLNVGTVPVRFTDSRLGSAAFGEMTQKKSRSLARSTRSMTIARLTNLSATDFDSSAPIQTVSTGMPFTMVAGALAGSVQRLRLDLDRAGEYLARSGGKFFYFVCRETVDPKARLHARMIFYNGDDPATGSAAGCCAAWMVAHGVAASDEQVLIEQGLEMHRPSRIFVRATKMRVITMLSMCVSVEIV